jgi:hypothetical protein
LSKPEKALVSTALISAGDENSANSAPKEDLFGDLSAAGAGDESKASKPPLLTADVGAGAGVGDESKASKPPLLTADVGAGAGVGDESNASKPPLLAASKAVVSPPMLFCWDEGTDEKSALKSKSSSADCDWLWLCARAGDGTGA